MNPWLSAGLGYLLGALAAASLLGLADARRIERAREEGYKAGVRATLAVAAKARGEKRPAELNDPERRRVRG